jgi:hypothetical protein
VRIFNSKLLLSLLVHTGYRTHAKFSSSGVDINILNTTSLNQDKNCKYIVNQIRYKPRYKLIQKYFSIWLDIGV